MLKIKVELRNRWIHLVINNSQRPLQELLNDHNIKPENVKIMGYNYPRGECDVLVYTNIPLAKFNCLAFGLHDEY